MVVAAWSGELVSRPSDSPTLTAASPPTVLTAVVQPARQAAPVIEVDGGIFYSPAWGHAPGASVGVGRTPRDGGAGVRLLGAYQSARDVPLEGGTNEVQRFIAGAAVTYQLERRRLFAAGDAGLVGTLTRHKGRDTRRTVPPRPRTSASSPSSAAASAGAGRVCGRTRVSCGSFTRRR